MSEEEFSEVSEEGWFSRIGGAIKGVVIGVVLFLVAFPLLFWNEGRAVKTAKSLTEGANSVIAIQADSITPANNEKLVYLTGNAKTDDILKDSKFGISENGIKLTRSVETYQWEEDVDSRSEKKLGGGKVTKKTYSYDKVWNSSLIDSSDFKNGEGHQNPRSVEFESKTFLADTVTIGAFELSDNLKNRIKNAKSIALDINTLPALLKDKTSIQGNFFMIKKDKSKLSIGDQRISFKIVKPADISIIAKQVEDTFESYTTSVGGSISLLEMGIVSSKAMFEKVEAENAMLSWILRLVGFILMVIGITLILKPLSILADIVPFIGSIVEFGSLLIALVVAAFFSIITIAIAWIFYRPLLGIGLIVVAIAICAVAYFMKNKKA